MTIRSLQVTGFFLTMSGLLLLFGVHHYDQRRSSADVFYAEAIVTATSLAATPEPVQETLLPGHGLSENTALTITAAATIGLTLAAIPLLVWGYRRFEAREAFLPLMLCTGATAVSMAFVCVQIGLLG